MNRNLLILTLSQIFSFTAAPVTVFLSGIIGSQISPLQSLSTLPMSISVVGIAIGAIFATKVMSLIGRKAGFISASIGNSVTSLIAAFAILQQSFYLFSCVYYTQRCLRVNLPQHDPFHLTDKKSNLFSSLM